jgi:hypothetical protein
MDMSEEEGGMADEDTQKTELTVESDETDVELHSTPDVVDDDDDVEAHTWRAQS